MDTLLNSRYKNHGSNKSLSLCMYIIHIIIYAFKYLWWNYNEIESNNELNKSMVNSNSKICFRVHSAHFNVQYVIEVHSYDHLSVDQGLILTFI